MRGSQSLDSMRFRQQPPKGTVSQATSTAHAPATTRASQHHVATRLVAASLGVAAVLAAVLALAAPPVAGAPAPGAQAYLTSIAGDVNGDLRVGPAVKDDSALTYTRQTKGLVAFSRGSSSVSSALVGKALVSDAEVTVSGIDILDGVVTADSVAVVATATAGTSALGTSTDGCDINGLQVNGKPVAQDSGTLQIDGVGELTILDITASSGGGAASVETTGLRLVLDHDVGDQPAGTVIVVGDALANADAGTATDLHRLSVAPANPKTAPAPTPKPKPKPTPTPSPVSLIDSD